jgi:hypothetical protein
VFQQSLFSLHPPFLGGTAEEREEADSLATLGMTNKKNKNNPAIDIAFSSA